MSAMVLSLWDRRSFSGQRPPRHRPRQRQRRRIEADLVVAGLVLQMPRNRDRLLALQRGLCLRSTFDNHVSEQLERLLEYRHALLQRREEVDLRRWIRRRESAHKRLRLDVKRD